MVQQLLRALLIPTLLASALPAHAQSDDARTSIMRPEPKYEPWLVPKYKSPRGTRQHVVIPRPASPPQPAAPVPLPLYVPETGRVLPNLPAPGSSSRETYQDRAARCAHQAGVYGQAAGDRNSYIGSCVNQ